MSRVLDYLETEVLADRVELRCPRCNALGIVFAEAMEDLQKLEAMKGIKLKANTCKFLAEQW